MPSAIKTYLLPDPTPIERSLLRLISGSSAGLAVWEKFPCGEDFVTARGAEKKVCVVGRVEPPGDNFFRTMLLVDTLRRSGAERVIAVLPYYAYARQDRQMFSGEALSPAMIAAALAAAGAWRIVTADLHSDRTRESAPLPIASVSLIGEMAAVLRRSLPPGAAVVAPDRGAKRRADLFAAALGLKTEAAWIEKRRHPVTGKVAASDLRGEVSGAAAVLVDDLLDTGGTIEAAVRVLRKKGFEEFHLAVTHPVFSSGAARRMKRLKFKSVIVSNTIPASKEVLRLQGLKVVDAAGKLAEEAMKE